MGNIKRFDLGRIIGDYHIKNFVETGTFHGDGVAYALQFPFQKLWSVEIVPQLAGECRSRFVNEDRVSIVCRDSVTAIKQHLPTLTGPAVYWLDAHFPGADAGLTSYESENEDIRLPLALELAAIAQSRNTSKDVFILDDLRIYEDGAYELGNVPKDARPFGERNIHFAEKLFGVSHKIIRSYRDEGYLILFPRKAYFWKHFSIPGLFGKEVEDDPYMH